MKVDFRYAVSRLLLVAFGLALGSAFFGTGFWIYRLCTKGTVASSVDTPAIMKQLEKTAYVYDDVLSYRFKPNFRGILDPADGRNQRSTNSVGVIGPEEKPNPDRDVLILGDSVAYGYYLPVRDSFASKMSTQGRKIWNASCPGWTTFQEVEFYNRYLEKIGPWRHVLLCVCLNDLTRFEWVYRNGKYDMEEGTRELQQRSPAEFNSTTVASFSAPTLEPLMKLHSGYLDAWTPDRWNIHFFSHVLPLSKKCRLTVVVFPLAAQLSSLELGGDPDVVFWPQHHLKNWCEENEIAYVDIFPCIRELHGAILDECHLSRAAHERIATRLCEYLDRE